MVIELATINDAEEILDMQRLAYKSEAEIYNDYFIAPLSQSLEGIRIDLEKQVFLKAAADGKIIGSVRAHMGKDTCYIGRLIVHPDYQNQGIGTKLMNEIESHFSHAKRFELFTGHKSEKNLHLYRKLGYREFKNEAVTEVLTLVYMEKSSREDK